MSTVRKYLLTIMYLYAMTYNSTIHYGIVLMVAALFTLDNNKKAAVAYTVTAWQSFMTS